MCGIVGGLTPNIALGADAIEWFRFGEFAGWLIEGERG